MTQQTEKQFFANDGPVAKILAARGIDTETIEAYLDGWFDQSTDHGFDGEKVADAIAAEIAESRRDRHDDGHCKRESFGRELSRAGIRAAVNVALEEGLSVAEIVKEVERAVHGEE